MTTITIVTVEKDYAGSGTIRITGTYADATFSFPGQRQTIGEQLTTDPRVARYHQITNDAYFVVKGTAGVAFTINSMTLVATTMSPSLTHAPVFTLSPGAVTASGSATATATLTISGAVGNNQTVTVGNKTYTFKTSLTPTEGEVLIGASDAEALDNLKLAINRTDPGSNDGVKYKVAAAHTQISATTNTNTTQVFEALTSGPSGNTLASTETMTNGSFAGSTFSGGAAVADFTATASSETLVAYTWHESADGATYGNALTTTGIYDVGGKASQTLTSDTTAPSNGDVVIIGGVTYIYRTTLTSPSVANEVLIGISAAVALDNLKSAINATAGAGTTYGTGTVAHPLVTATTNTDTTQVVEAIAPGTESNAIIVSETSSHLSWGGSTLASGTNSAAGDHGLRLTMTDTSKNGYYYLARAINLTGATNSTPGTLTVT